MRGRSRSSRRRELSSFKRRSFKSAMDCFLFFTSPPARISYAAGIVACLWGEAGVEVVHSTAQYTSLVSRSMLNEGRGKGEEELGGDYRRRCRCDNAKRFVLSGQLLWEGVLVAALAIRPGPSQSRLNDGPTTSCEFCIRKLLRLTPILHIFALCVIRPEFNDCEHGQVSKLHMHRSTGTPAAGFVGIERLSLAWCRLTRCNLPHGSRVRIHLARTGHSYRAYLMREVGEGGRARSLAKSNTCDGNFKSVTDSSRGAASS